MKNILCLLCRLYGVFARKLNKRFQILANNSTRYQVIFRVNYYIKSGVVTQLKLYSSHYINWSLHKSVFV